jgi:hypothetical protein
LLRAAGFIDECVRPASLRIVVMMLRRNSNRIHRSA